MKVIVHVCPGVVERFGHELRRRERLAENLYLAQIDAASVLPRLCWDVLEVVAEQGQGTLAHAGFLSSLETQWGEMGLRRVTGVSRGLSAPAQTMAARLGSGKGPLEALLGRRRAFVVQPRLVWLEDRLNRGAERAIRAAEVSRAEVKFIEAEAILSHLGVAFHSGARWLDIGAAPGGITRRLASLCGVTAIDLAPLHPDVAGLDDVRSHVVDGLSWQTDEVFDGIVCDMNGSPARALAAVEAQLGRLRLGGVLMWTLKLPSWPALRGAIEDARERLEAQGVELLTWQRLRAHRSHEVALFGRRLQAAQNSPLGN